MLVDNRLLPATQTSAFFHGQIAYDDDYTGLAATLGEGERLAALMGTKPIVFMKNHGVLVTGDDGRAGVPAPLPDRARLPQPDPRARHRPAAAGASDEVAARVKAPNPDDSHPRGERERLFFEAMMRVLDRELPGYRD